ncbi:MAG: response regulator transcription factor, partial [Comamonadaceae bacterium]
MATRVFIKVIGFTDEERHALNTVFRLSEQCRTMYQLWTPEAPEPPGMALLDADSHEAGLEAESPRNAALPMLWVGPAAPAQVWRSFTRPLSWPDIVAAIDAVFVDAPAKADPVLGPAAAVMSSRQALIVGASRDERLYLRARLALARLTLADEAETGIQAIDLAAGKQYDVALLGSALPDMDTWAVLRQLRDGRRAVPHVAVIRAQRSVSEQLRAWLGGAGVL